jgi:hypothetical protein
VVRQRVHFSRATNYDGTTSNCKPHNNQIGIHSSRQQCDAWAWFSTFRHLSNSQVRVLFFRVIIANRIFIRRGWREPRSSSLRSSLFHLGVGHTRLTCFKVTSR